MFDIDKYLDDISNVETEADYMPLLPTIDLNNIQQSNKRIDYDATRWRVVADLDNEEYHADCNYTSSSLLKAVLSTEKCYIAAVKSRDERSQEHYERINSGLPKETAVRKEFALNKGDVVHDSFEDFANHKGSAKAAMSQVLKTWQPWSEDNTTSARGTIYKDRIDLERRLAPSEVLIKLKSFFDDLKDKGLLPLLKQAISEMSIFDYSDMTKVRPDILVKKDAFNGDRNIHFAIKSAASLGWYRSMEKGYKLSYGLYNLKLQEMTGEKWTTIVLIFDYKTGLVKIQEISEVTMVAYRKTAQTALDKIKKINPQSPKGYSFEVI